MYRILIASGDEVLRRTLAFSLHDMDTKVDFAPTKEDMLAMCRTSKFNLIMLVGTMLPMCRQDVMEVLRPDGQRPPKIYVISWQHADLPTQRLLRSGVDQYMTLPVNLHRLRNKILNELSAWRS